VLLDRARLLQGKPARGRPPYPGAGPGGPVNAGADLTRLSERELEVASLVVAGLTYKQIGDRLFISPKTIEHHVARMRQRLGCESRADRRARRRGLVAETVTWAAASARSSVRAGSATAGTARRSVPVRWWTRRCRHRYRRPYLRRRYPCPRHRRRRSIR